MEFLYFLFDALKQPALRLLGWLLYSHLFLALCAGAITQATLLQLGVEGPLPAAAWFVAFATLGVYNLHHLLGPKQTASAHLQHWLRSNGFSVLLLCVIGLGGAAVLFFLLPFAAQVLALVLAVVVALYELPAARRWRSALLHGQLGVLKSFVVAGVWALATVLLPVWDQAAVVGLAPLLLILVVRFAFFAMLALAFDARDRDVDGANGLNTLPVRYGFAFVRQGMLLLALVAVVAGIILHTFILPDLIRALAITTSLLLTLVVASRTPQPNQTIRYLLLVDGQMLLQWLLLYFSQRL